MRLRIPFIFDDIGGADAPVKWEYEFRGHYDAYEQGNNDKIEAAYQKYQANKSRHTYAVEITQKGKWKFTINFFHMNATSHGGNKKRLTIRRTVG